MKKETIEIKKGIKIPQEEVLASSSGRKGYRRLKYPWLQMKVGDSFETGVRKATVIGAARLWVKRHKSQRIFVAQDLGKGKTRVWRLK